MTDTTSYEAVLEQMTAAESGSEVNTSKTEADGATDATEDSDTENFQADPDQEEPESDPEDGPEEAPEDEAEGEDGDDEEQEADPDLAPLEASPLWDEETKAEFASMDRVGQAILLKQEGKFRSYYESKVKETAETRKQAEQTTTQYAARMSEVEQSLQSAEMLFLNKWEKVDWKEQERASPEQARRLWEVYQTEARLGAELEQRVTKEKEQFIASVMAEESKKLRELGEADPITRKLTDPNTSEKQLTAVANFLMERGVVKYEDLKFVKAAELEIAHEAMLYRQIIAKGKQKVDAPREATSKTKTRPSAVPNKSSQPRNIQKAQNSFNQKKDRDSLLELMVATAQKPR